MSNRRVPSKPEATADKRRARRQTRRRQAAMGITPARPVSQMSHASGPAGRRKAREGERVMEAQRAVRPGGPDSDAALLGAARRQLATVLKSGSAAAFLGWWAAWKEQDGVRNDDLVDMVKEARAEGLLP
jgi:hypothetical protein